MTDVCWRMFNEDDDDKPAKCRERRSRRIEMRRLGAASAVVSSTLAIQSKNKNRVESESSGCVAQAKRICRDQRSDLLLPFTSFLSRLQDVEGPAAEPVYGTMSVSGRSRDMEDRVAVKTSLCRPEINRWRPVHFFAVYDGHGGSRVAELCRERMHVFIKEELTRVRCTDADFGQNEQQGREFVDKNWKERWTSVMKLSFERMEKVVMSTCACGDVECKCGCDSMEMALGGSTAVVAVLTPEYIVVANCGDSRAVLCRAGKAIPLSFDHKPDRPDELSRITAAGGRVFFVNGARVQGILAMSRAIGDKFLKPIVISEPEITFTKREADDDCLILASDGLWDVLSSDLACKVASKCLQEGNCATTASIDLNAGPQMEDEGALYPSRSVLAVALLTRLALARNSSDNISVVVVDLKRS